jgi:hypothetical protein
MIEDTVRQAVIEGIARAIVRYRISAASADMLEGYGIPFGAAAELNPDERDRAEAAAIEQAWPAWRGAARLIIEAIGEAATVTMVEKEDARALGHRLWQERTPDRDRRKGDRRKAVS